MAMDELHPATRREFLNWGTGLIGFGLTVPTFLSDTLLTLARAADGARTQSKPGVPEEHVLVVVQLAGGNDGLNMLVPFRNDFYYRARPSLAVPANRVLRINDDLGWHPEAQGFKALWDAGRLSIVQNVGYPNPNRSHFVSTRIWESASPDGRMADGWLGRYFDHSCKGNDPPNSRQAIVLVEEVPLALRGQRFQPICVDRPQTYGARLVQPRGVGKNERRSPTKTKSGKAESSDSTLDFLRRSALDAEVGAEEIRAAARTTVDGVAFPDTAFGRALRTVAVMISSGFTTKVYYVSLSGFDTHARQIASHPRLLAEAGEALGNLITALRRTGDSQRTLIMTFSEFGRRVEENASGGTDHGQAAPMLLLGDAVRAGVHGTAPKLDQLVEGDLTFETDFSQVYATVLREWLGADPNPLLGGTWESLPLLKT